MFDKQQAEAFAKKRRCEGATYQDIAAELETKYVSKNGKPASIGGIHYMVNSAEYERRRKRGATRVKKRSTFQRAESDLILSIVQRVRSLTIPQDSKDFIIDAVLELAHDKT